jgi:hypothetical protein
LSSLFEAVGDRILHSGHLLESAGRLDHDVVQI